MFSVDRRLLFLLLIDFGAFGLTESSITGQSSCVEGKKTVVPFSIKKQAALPVFLSAGLLCFR